MTQLETYYEQTFNQFALKSESSWLKDLRTKAMHEYETNGLPTRKTENWKYTSIKGIADCEFVKFDAGVSNNSSIQNNIDIKDGEITIPESFSSDAIIIKSMSRAIVENEELVKKYLDIHAQSRDSFASINTALMQDGIFIYVTKEFKQDHPLYIKNFESRDKVVNHWRHLVVAEVGAEISIVETFNGEGEYFNNSVTEIVTLKDAKVNFYKLQQESAQAFHVSNVYAYLMKGSEVNAYCYNFGGKIVRSDTEISFLQSHASCTMQGLTLATDNQHIDTHTLVDHKVANCNSHENYKGIISGKAHNVFNGIVKVAEGAVQTDSSQYNKNLLLSKDAMVDTKPQLEIFADDVKCAHGATVGEIDKNALFYLRSRGLCESEARKLLVSAFALDVLQAIGNEEVKSKLQIAIDEKLQRI